MKDRVLIEEREWDRQQTANEVRYEQCNPEAVAAFESGELDDWFIDEAQPYDTCKVALATLSWLEAFNNGSYDSHDAALEALTFVLSRNATEIASLRLVIQDIIEEKTKMLMEDS